jgi:hypothetical protein
MGSIGDCFDNAVAESFFATLESELLDRRSWPTKRELSSAVFDFIEGFYNPPDATPRSATSARQTTKRYTPTGCRRHNRPVHGTGSTPRSTRIVFGIQCHAATAHTSG